MTTDPYDLNMPDLHRDIALLTLEDPYPGIAPDRIKQEMINICLDISDYLQTAIPDGSMAAWPAQHTEHIERLEERLWFLLRHQHSIWRYQNRNPRGRL